MAKNQPSKLASVDKVPKYMPELSLDEDHLSAIKNWKVGGKYEIVLKVEEISMSKGDMYGPFQVGQKPKPKISARFRITSVSTPNKQPKSSGKQKGAEAYQFDSRAQNN